MRISDWSSDVCSSDLHVIAFAQFIQQGRDRLDGQPPDTLGRPPARGKNIDVGPARKLKVGIKLEGAPVSVDQEVGNARRRRQVKLSCQRRPPQIEVDQDNRSEEHTSELQSLMRISYAVFCLNKKIKN